MLKDQAIASYTRVFESCDDMASESYWPAKSYPYGSGLNASSRNRERLRSYFIQCLLLFFLCPIVVSVASPLDDLLQTPELKDGHKRAYRDKENELSKLVDPSTNYGQLVLEDSNTTMVWDWLGHPSAQFKLLRSRVKRTHEFMEFTQILKSRAGFETHAKVFIPYPKFIQASGMGLITEFAGLSPPDLQIEYAEDITVHEMPAKVYHRLDRSTSLLIKLPRNSLINFVVVNPAAVTSMIELAQSLDMKNLAEKLEK